jgi:ATP synthase F1 delta subunit
MQVQTKKPYPVAAAEALLAAAQKQGGDIYAPYKALQKWQVAQTQIPNFQAVFDHPMTAPERKSAFLTEFAGHFGADKATVEALQKVASDNKWTQLPEISRVYHKLAAEANKDMIVTVTSADALSKDELAAVQKNLASIVKKGYKLNVVEKVNPAIMGGLLIEADGVHQDLSLVTALTNLDATLETAVNKA